MFFMCAYVCVCMHVYNICMQLCTLLYVCRTGWNVGYPTVPHFLFLTTGL